MIRVSIKNIFISIILIYQGFLPAQYQSIRLTNLSIEHGLSQNMVRCILQDSKGFMWFGTWDGLNRYDGYEFNVYKNISNDSSSLRLNRIRTVIEDHNKVLWVATFGGGLSRFNAESETFTNFLHNPADSKSICSDRVTAIFEDSYNRIWVGTENGGLSVFDNNNLDESHKKNYAIQFVNITANHNDSSSISNNGIQLIFEDIARNIWFGTSDGNLNKLQPGKDLFSDFKFVKYSPKWNLTQIENNLWYNDAVEDKNHSGLFWLLNYYQGLIWFDSRTGKFLYEYPFIKFPSNFPISQVTAFGQDNEGKYWFGTGSNGIFTFNPEAEKSFSSPFEYYPLNTIESNGVSVSNISSFYQDRSGLIWIGTATNGLYTFNERANKFRNYFYNPSNENSLGGKDALSVLETNNGDIWIGTESGLDKFDHNTKKFIHFKNNPNDAKSLSNNIVYSLHQDPKGILWVGTASGLNKFNSVTNSFEHFKYDRLDSNSISTGEIIKIFSDSKGFLWLGSWTGGLNKFIPGVDGKPDKFLHYRFNQNDPTSISNNRIMSIAEDLSGHLWIGTSDGGLNKLISDYSFAKDGSLIPPKFIRYQYDSDNPDGLSNNDVRSLLIDKKGILWIGTFGGGLNKFVPDEGETKFIHYSQTNGLANDVVRSILEDDNSNLWIGTAYGLSKFKSAAGTFWNFYESDGIQTSKFEDVFFKSKRDGALYFGGVNGVVAFQPADVKINSYIPQIVISSFKRYNTDGTKGTTIVEKGISEKKEIKLSYKDNILTFEFAALNFFNSSKNSYTYKLEGYNENWIQLGTKRDVTFTNLDPGEYTLYVKGSNGDGVWNNNALSLKIIITPPWWRSNWAYSFYMLAIIMGIFAADRIMRRRVITKERDRAKLREAELIKKQAEELETVDKLVRVINNAENLETLFTSLLHQTIKFIPQAEKAAVFLLDHKDNLFHVAFTSGYEISNLAKISFMPEELKMRYTENSNEIEKGIYIISNTGNLFGDEKLSAFSKAKSMLVMAVEWDNSLEAYFVFDSFADKNAFNPSTARILHRFREHAVSAISKAQSLKTLQEKNEEIIKTQEQLVTQQKLASLGALTAGIAHEIKNPLNFVNNFAEMSQELLEELKIEFQNNNKEEVLEIAETLKQNLEKINQHGKRADSIVKGMLLHSRGSSGEKMPTNLNNLLDQYVNLAYHGLRAQDKDFNITIEKDYDDSIGKINIVPQDMSRVFLNVINNACYAANQKKLKDGKDLSPVLKVSTKNIGEKVEIKIWDNGDGVPPSVKGKLFNPFFTTKPAGEGTGLGLSLSYDIVVKQHSGEIKFESEEGSYTEFVIMLPKL
jgi:ligand-binding sensor domain-containing protein/signal transduction histidine kinase